MKIDPERDVAPPDEPDYLRRAVDRMPSTLAYWDRNLICRFANQAFEQWFGVQADKLVGRSLRDLLGAELFRLNEPYILGALRGEAQTFERLVPGPNDIQRPSLAHYLPDVVDGAVVGFVAHVHEVTLLKEREARLFDLTQRDPLTGALNRTGFERALDEAMQSGGGANLALLYIDLDNFKPLNDRYGHPVGDRILEAFVQRLRGLVRSTDAIARLGGDEFAVALFDLQDRPYALEVADKVLACCQAPFHFEPLLLQVGTSVGVAFGAGDAGGWRQLVQRADAALIAAKAAGKGQRVVASSP
jgi:diguanylate cyclase (GGDEF)-like protein/PAS domain S-box-containing protein